MHKVVSLASGRVHSVAMIGESHVLTASCGFFYTMAVTKDGALWTFGMVEQGKLGHNNSTIDLCRRVLRHNTLVTPTSSPLLVHIVTQQR